MVMQYIGSKRQFAQELLKIVLSDRHPGQYYIEPFCGSCSMLKMVSGNRIGGDLNFYLISLFKAVQLGWEPPKIITEEEYTFIKNNKDIVPACLVGYAGCYFSFGAKFLGTYKRDSKLGARSVNTKKVSSVSNRDIVNLRYSLKGVSFYNVPYSKLTIPKGSIVYCDPPYRGTTGYTTGDFCTDSFWGWVRGLSKYCKVYVSEMEAPDDFKCVWSADRRLMINNSVAHRKQTEKLFIYGN